MKRALRFVTWNIHGSVGLDGKREPSRIADALDTMAADVIGLQEVEARPARSPLAQAPFLAEQLGMHLAEGPLLLEGGHGYGNILLSRWPIVATSLVMLPTGPGEPRGCIDATLEDPRGQIWRVLVTHLDWRRRARRSQLRRLVDLLRSSPPGTLAEPPATPSDAEHAAPAAGPQPTVLLGDLNEWHVASPGIRALRRHIRLLPARATFPSRFPLLPLDRIGHSTNLTPTAPISHGPLACRTVSDHMPLVADLLCA